MYLRMEEYSPAESVQSRHYKYTRSTIELKSVNTGTRSFTLVKGKPVQDYHHDEEDIQLSIRFQSTAKNKIIADFISKRLGFFIYRFLKRFHKLLWLFYSVCWLVAIILHRPCKYIKISYIIRIASSIIVMLPYFLCIHVDLLKMLVSRWLVVYLFLNTFFYRISIAYSLQNDDSYHTDDDMEFVRWMTFSAPTDIFQVLIFICIDAIPIPLMPPHVKSSILGVMVLVFFYYLYVYIFCEIFREKLIVTLYGSGKDWLLSDIAVGCYSTVGFYLLGFFVLSLKRPGKYFLLEYYCQWDPYRTSCFQRNLHCLSNPKQLRQATESTLNLDNLRVSMISEYPQGGSSFRLTPTLIEDSKEIEHVFPQHIPDHYLRNTDIILTIEYDKSISPDILANLFFSRERAMKFYKFLKKHKGKMAVFFFLLYSLALLNHELGHVNRARIFWVLGNIISCSYGLTMHTFLLFKIVKKMKVFYLLGIIVLLKTFHMVMEIMHINDKAVIVLGVFYHLFDMFQMFLPILLDAMPLVIFPPKYREAVMGCICAIFIYWATKANMGKGLDALVKQEIDDLDLHFGKKWYANDFDTTAIMTVTYFNIGFFITGLIWPGSYFVLNYNCHWSTDGYGVYHYVCGKKSNKKDSLYVTSYAVIPQIDAKAKPLSFVTDSNGHSPSIDVDRAVLPTVVFATPTVQNTSPSRPKHTSFSGGSSVGRISELGDMWSNWSGASWGNVVIAPDDTVEV